MSTGRRDAIRRELVAMVSEFTQAGSHVDSAVQLTHVRFCMVRVLGLIGDLVDETEALERAVTLLKARHGL